MFLFIHKAASEVAFWYIYFDCLMQLRGGMNMDGKWNETLNMKLKLPVDGGKSLS